MQIEKYQVVYSVDVDELNAKVNGLIEEGYEAFGGLQIFQVGTKLKFIQALVIGRPPRPKGLTRWVKTSDGGHWERMEVPVASPEASREAGVQLSLIHILQGGCA